MWDGVQGHMPVDVGGTGAERGAWASPGSGTGGRAEGLRPSWPTTAVPRLPAYRRGTHKCSQLVRPEGKKHLLTHRDGDGDGPEAPAKQVHRRDRLVLTPCRLGPPSVGKEGPRAREGREPPKRVHSAPPAAVCIPGLSAQEQGTGDGGRRARDGTPT